MDAFACSMSGGSIGISKNFDSIALYPAQLRIEFPSASSSSPRPIENEISEGAYKSYDVDSIGKAATQVQIFLDYSHQGSYYYLQAKSGKLYVNRKNGKMRYTSDAEITLYGPKYTGSGFSGYYSRTVNFSSECGAQF